MTKLIRPLFYHCRRGVSDCNWIIQRIKCIPEDRRREVSNRYETLFLTAKNGRKAANEYLDAIASEYRVKPAREIKLKTAPVKPKSKAREYKSNDGLWSKEL